MSQDGQTWKKWFLIGATVLLIGLALQWYPAAFISGMTERLSLSNLTTAQRTAIQDDINNWNIWQVSVFQPLSLTFFTLGILILVFSILTALYSLASDYLISKQGSRP
jgi:hypothetical protein